MEKNKYFDPQNPGPEPSIFWQDEILQVMYWMRGEGFEADMTMAGLQRFLQEPHYLLEINLEQLIKRGLVEKNIENGYKLTETGVLEGGRRFADEFEGLTNQGHYECNDPDCDCKTGEPCLVAGHTH